MKTIMILILSLGASLAYPAQADMMLRSTAPDRGGLVGNGGGTVVCRDPRQKIKSIELLDFYEARTLRNMHIDIQKFQGDWKAKAAAIIARIESKSELRFKLYSAWLQNFAAEQKLLTDVQFSTVPDSGYIGVPAGCEFEQAAIQRQPIFLGDARYYLNAELWNAMDDSQKAGLVLHEIIYREAIGYGHVDSIRSRYLTGLYASSDFETQGQNDYWKVLEQAHYELTDIVVPDELKGSTTSWFDTSRVWQAGASDLNNLPTIELKDRLLARIGDCNEGCQTFIPTQLWKHLPNANSFYVNLSKDIHQLKVGGSTSLGGVTEAESAQNGESQATVMDGVDFYFTTLEQDQSASIVLTANQDFFGMSEDLVSKKVAERINQMELLRNPQGIWNWNYVKAGSVSIGGTQATQNGDHHGLVDSSDSCAFAIVVYKDGNPYRVMIGLGGPASCVNNSAQQYVLVTNQFSNGEAEAVFPTGKNSDAIEVLFDPLHPNVFQNSARTYGGWYWSTPGSSGLHCPESQVEVECLKPVFGADRKVIKLLVVNGVQPTLRFLYDGETFPGQLMSQYGTTVLNTEVNLYPSGAVKNFVNAIEFKIRQNKADVIVPAGATVDLDSDGKFSSFH